eukprot:CAMPEP_0197036138 /NCGR_PEP_ID=MMETSP1384-20130603/13738_1 /TAXON_ID=29189 /ORGANISM="Ammonia sp." /LENGTH=334 /DNA_ID=CAMNT_0042466279 /DNA_START=105 /DNA_END=1109 /DNA_ORIENTATION=+
MAQVRLSKILQHTNSIADHEDGNHSMSKQPTASSSRSTTFETYAISPPSECIDLRGKTIFISGGSRGIGLAVALRCARDSCNIVLAAKTAEPHPTLPGTIYTAAKQVESVNGSKCLPVICDIRKEDMVRNAVEKAVETFGGIDILINNASAISISNTLSTTMKKYDLMHDVNARGTYLVTKCCLPYLMKSKRNPMILTMSPPLQYVNAQAMASKVAYMTAKLGMSLATVGWSAEFRKYGIGVNSLWPRTPIATAAVNNVLGGAALMKRSRTPEIHADAAYVILTQPSARFTGNFVWDEDILRQTGVTDFDEYRFDKSVDDKEIPRLSATDSWLK